MGCISNKVTFSAAFPKYLQSRSVRLLSFLSPGFTKRVIGYYFVVLSRRADRGLCVELRGRQVFLPNVRKPFLTTRAAHRAQARKSPPLRTLGGHWIGVYRGLLQRLGDGVHDAEIQWIGAFGMSRSRKRPSSCSPAAFHAAILQFTPRWSDPSHPQGRRASCRVVGQAFFGLVALGQDVGRRDVNLRAPVPFSQSCPLPSGCLPRPPPLAHSSPGFTCLKFSLCLLLS